MKKKIKDLTPLEVDKICKKLNSCKKCPLYPCLEPKSEKFLEREVEVDE